MVGYCPQHLHVSLCAAASRGYYGRNPQEGVDMRKLVSVFLITCMVTLSCKVPAGIAEASDTSKTTGGILGRIGSLTEKAKNAAVESTNKLKESVAVGIDKGKDIVGEAKDAAVESTDKVKEGMATGIDKAKDMAGKAKEVAVESTDKIKEGVAVGLDKGKEYADVIVIAALAVSEAIRASVSYQKAMEVIQNPGAFSSAYGHLSRFRSNLDWSNIDPAKYLRTGTRGVSRGMMEAQKVWETIPKQIRASGPEATARYLEGKDWSHIKAHSLGGSNAASNGIFEDASLNRARGNTRMTPQAIKTAQGVLQSHAFHATLLESAKNAMKGGVTAAAIMAVVAVLEYGLQYQKGEITEDEMYRAIGKAIAMAGLSGAAVAGLVTAMALAFPAIMPVLSALSVPLMVIGFSVMGVKLVTLGKGWYEVYMSDQPLKPIALQYWMAKRYETVKDKTAGIVTTAVNDLREFAPVNWQRRPALSFR